MINYRPRTIKGHAVAYFIAEFTYIEEQMEELPELLPFPDPNTLTSTTSMNLLPEVPVWVLQADGAFNLQGSGAGLVLITYEANTLEIVLKFLFKASNNEAEYKAIISGLRIAGDL